MSPLLGITYTFDKALPNLFGQSPINLMETPKHLGEKLKNEAERRGLKPADIARLFVVKPPSVYEWYQKGRIDRKHYQKLVDWSGRSIEWWLDLRERPASDTHWTDKAKILAELFDALPDDPATRQRVFMDCSENIRAASVRPSTGPQTPAPMPFLTLEKSVD